MFNNYMNVKYWTQAGKIRADKIETNSLKIGSTQITDSKTIRLVGGVSATPINYKDHNGNNQTMYVLTDANMLAVSVLGNVYESE